MVRRAAIGLLATGAALSAAPATAAPWTSPSVVARPGNVHFVGPGLVLGANGNGLAAWHPSAPDAGDIDRPTAPLGGVVLRNGRFRSAGRLQPRHGRLHATDVAIAGRRVVAAGMRGHRFRGPALVASGRIGGRLGPPRVKLPRLQALGASLATNARGDVALVIVVKRPRNGVSNAHVELLVRRHGHRFGRPVRVSPRGAIGSVSVAMNAAGDVLVAYTRDRRAEAHVRTAGGRLLRRRRLGVAHRSTTLDATIGAARRAAVVWESGDVELGFSEGPTEVWAATAPRGGRFGRATRMERFGLTTPYPDVAGCEGATSEDIAGAVAATSSGRAATVAWTGFENGRLAVRVADVHGGEVGTPQTLATGRDTCLGDVADGVALLTHPASRAIEAAVRPPGGAGFGPPEPVADEAHGGFDPRVAIDPGSGRAIAVWTRDAGIVAATRGAPAGEPPL